MHDIWALGCSFTRGTGVAEKDCWVSQLSNLLGKPIENLGIEGAAPKRVWHRYQELRAEYQPKLTIIQWPGTVRDTVYLRGQAVNLGLWNVNDYPLYRQQLVSGQTERQNQQLIARAKTIITELAIHFDVRSIFYPFQDLAEDHVHPGVKTHEQIALWVKQQLDSKGPAAVSTD